MPTDERILGFSNRWYKPAIAAAQDVELGGLRIRLVAPVYFLATKLEAFRGRGHDDVSGSSDLEDLIAVIDGRPEIVAELQAASADVRAYIASELRQLLGVSAFVEALSGLLLPDSASQARRPLLLERLTTMAASAPERTK